MVLGAVAALGLAVVPTLAVTAGLGLAVVALVRRRHDAYKMFVIGFVIGCAVYVALAITVAYTSDPSSGWCWGFSQSVEACSR